MFGFSRFDLEIRKIYPGNYDDLSDQEPVDKRIRKYPADKEKVQIDSLFRSQRKQVQPERKPYENKYSGLSDELSMSVHKSKTFVLPEIITFVLYYVGFFVLGFIINPVYPSSSNFNRRITGSDPPGKGCLVFLPGFHLFLFLVLIIHVVTGVILIF